MLHKSAIVVCQSEKRAKLVHIAGDWPIPNRIYLCWIRCDGVVRYDMAQELDARLEQLALSWLSAKAVLSQRRQNHGDVLEMLLQGARVDARVVDELAHVASVD
eukprot:1504009-Rhodomonas_salina.1